MKLAGFFAGLAAAAIMGSAASAQYVQTTQYGAASTNSNQLGNANPLVAGRYFLATEFPIASQNAATLTIGIASAGATAAQWNNPGAATFTINLQNAVFSSAVNASALTAPGGGAGCLAGDISVASGGTVGSNSVSFSIANIAACNQNLSFSSANGVQLTATNADFTSTLIRQLDGSSINGGSGTTASPSTGAFIQQLPGFSFSNNGVPVQPILLAAPAYTTLGAPSFGAGFFINTGSSFSRGVQVPVRADLAGTTMAGLVSAAAASLVVPEPSGISIANSTLSGPSFGPANAVDISVQLNGGNSQFGVFLNLATSVPAAPIQGQTVRIQPSVTFTAASGIPQRIFSAIPVVRLSRQGQQTQAFSWVGDGTTTSAISVFRHTGVPASVPGIRFILSNATNGASFNGEYVVPASAVTRSAGGEVITTSLNLSQIAGNFGRADVVWVFDQAPGTPINTQRFVQAPNGTLAPAPEENAVRTNAVAAFN